MTTELVGIPPAQIETVWPLVERPIADALAFSGGRFRADDIRAAMRPDARGAASLQLWVAWDKAAQAVRAVAVTEIRVLPRGRKACHVLILTGSGRKTWQHHLDALMAWAKAQDCAWFEAWARPGWERVFRGRLRKTHVMLEARL